ncbi:MAG: sulfate adenylyltransferase, partial [Deltaproteobacteria bacterium]
MSDLIVPHGKQEKLMPLLLDGQELKKETERAKNLKHITMTTRETSDCIMMGIGAFTPLTGFMTKADWQGVCDRFVMADGTFWPIPITLSSDDENVKVGDDIALDDSETGTTIATMNVTEKYTIDKAHECTTIFNTADSEHPGVEKVMSQGKYNLGGPVKVLSESY